MATKGYTGIRFTPDSAEAHKTLPLRNARTHCEGALAAPNDRGVTVEEFIRERKRYVS